MIPPQKVFENKTGTGASSGVHFPNSINVLAQVNLSYGSTPTITMKLEGSHDNQNWIELASETWTSGTPQKLVKPSNEYYQFYRLNITVNTNVTIVSAYIGGNG
jgi:hypothetical protein